MSPKRIIPCLDFNKGRVVKGEKFENLRDAGDPVELARFYCAEGADELVFLDITATTEGRGTAAGMVRAIVREISIPLTVGGGIRTLEDCRALLDAGAAKISVNSAAVRDKTLIRRAADEFGSSHVVAAIDTKKAEDGTYHVLIDGGNTDAGLDALEWAAECENLGAGELLVTSKDADGVKNGYDLAITRQICDNVGIPIIASGGVGKLEHFLEVFTQTNASAALAASVFHFGDLTVGQVKCYLAQNGVSVR